jgi:hypothetical protein
MRARIFSKSPPGSMTMAWRVSSSTKSEQLHCKGPPGKVSMIIGLL